MSIINCVSDYYYLHFYINKNILSALQCLKHLCTNSKQSYDDREIVSILLCD